MTIWSQLVIEFAIEKLKKKHHCCITLCAFRYILKGVRSEVFVYLSEQLPLS